MSVLSTVWTDSNSALELSQEACAVLEKCYQQNQDFCKFHVYRLGISEEQVEKICHEALQEYWSGIPCDDAEDEQFIMSANCEGRDPQALLDRHIERLAEIHEQDDDQENGIWPFGLVAADNSHSPLVILMDKNRGLWKVAHCRIPTKELALPVQGFLIDEGEVDATIVEFGGRPAPGGLPPDYQYQFAIFNTATPYPSQAHGVIEVDSSYPIEEWPTTVVMGDRRHPQMSWEDVLETFPVSYGIWARNCTLPDGTTTHVSRHPHLFLCIDTLEPGKDVLIGKMVWEGDINRSDDELKQIGRTSKVETTRSSPDTALENIRRMAEEADGAARDRRKASSNQVS